MPLNYCNNYSHYSQLYSYSNVVKWVGDRSAALYFCRCNASQLRGNVMLFLVTFFHCANMLCLAVAVDVH